MTQCPGRVDLELGVSLALADLPPSATRELAPLAESAGYGSWWSAETRGYDAVADLAAVASVTERIGLGSGVLPVFTRAPALLAMSALTLQQLSGGRFRLGIGASSPLVVSEWMGIPFERPLDRVRDTIRVLRPALRGERVTYRGTTVTVSGLRLTLPAADTPILVGATGPQMLRLAGEEADGMIASGFVQPSYLDTWLRPFWTGVDASGRDRSEVAVVTTVLVALDSAHSVEFRAAARSLLGGYLAAPAYNLLIRSQGYGGVAAAIRDAASRNDRDALTAAVPDELVEAVFASEETLRDRIDAFANSGATTVLLQPFSVAGSVAQRTAEVRRFLATSTRGLIVNGSGTA